MLLDEVRISLPPPPLAISLLVCLCQSVCICLCISASLSLKKKVSFYFSILLFVSISPSCHVCVYAQVIFLYLPSCDRQNVARSCRKCLSPKPSPSSSTSCCNSPLTASASAAKSSFSLYFIAFSSLAARNVRRWRVWSSGEWGTQMWLMWSNFSIQNEWNRSWYFCVWVKAVRILWSRTIAFCSS